MVSGPRTPSGFSKSNFVHFTFKYQSRDKIKGHPIKLNNEQ